MQRTINAVATLFVLSAVLFTSFGITSTVYAAENPPVVKIAAVEQYTRTGTAGTKLTITIDGTSVTMFAPTKPFETGKNMPVAGATWGFKDQLCVLGLCTGYATFYQKIGKSNVKFAAYRI